MRDSWEEDRAAAVELRPVDWTWCDGLDHVEVVGDTVRFVAYVVDVAAGGRPQRRVVWKGVMPIAAVVEGLRRSQAALDMAESHPSLLGNMRH